MAPPYGTPPATVRHWKPTAGGSSGLHPMPGATEKWRESELTRWMVWDVKQIKEDRKEESDTQTKKEMKHLHRELTLGKSEAISVTAEWIFSEHGTKLKREILLNVILSIRLLQMFHMQTLNLENWKILCCLHLEHFTKHVPIGQFKTMIT